MLNLKDLKKTLLAGFLLPLSLSAQQTIADYNLLDNEGSLNFSVTGNQTLKHLNDKNEQTPFVVTGFVKNSYLLYESPTPIIVTGYTLVSSADKDSDPKSVLLEGSTDGSAWTVLSSQLGLSFGERYLSITTNVNKPTTYKYVRLTFRNNNGGNDLKLAEFQLLGYPSPIYDDLTKLGGTISGEYQGSSSETIANLVSNDMSKKFKQNGAKSFWVEYELNTPSTLAAYALSSANENKNNIRSWNLLASNDGESWDVIDVRSNKNFFQVANNMQIYKIGDDRKVNDWAAYADAMQDAGKEMFWAPYGSGSYMRETFHINPDSIHTGYNYWWMAHALDVMVDGYARTGDIKYRNQMNQLYNGAISHGGKGNLWNGFYDDMEWMALACLRAHEVHKIGPWKNASIQLWNWIKGGWNDNHGGGIQWVNADPWAKNACSNAPAIILAAQLYQLTGEQEYLDWAVKIFDWMNANLLFENGIVKDGFNNNNFEGWTLTYNQGTWIGGCLELYKITNDQKYYDIAMRTADYVVHDKKKFSPYGVLYNNEGGGDGGLFKGIFMRNLSQWILSGKLDEGRQNAFVAYFIENGKSVWETAMLKPNMMTKNTWYDRYVMMSMDASKKHSGYYASVHLSATMLFELLDEMNRKNLLPEGGQNPYASANKDKTYKYFRLEATSNNGGGNIELNKWQLFANDPTSGIDSEVISKSPVQISVLNQQVVFENEDMQVLDYQIYDLTGKLISFGKLVEAYKTVSLSEGAYVVKVSDKMISYSQKLIIQ